VRQHDLTFANFVCTFGRDKVLLDEATDIVFPVFFRDTLIRKFGDTQYYFYETKLRQFGERDGAPELAITGRFVKEAVLRRQQIVQDGKLVDDYRELETAPSAFFVLTLSDHRLMYFAETYQAPSIESFASTVQIFLRRVWREVLRDRHDESEEQVTFKALQRQTPMPTLEVVTMARQESIEESINSFSKVTLLRFKLIKPNDEPQPGSVLKSVRERYAPLTANRVDIEIGDSGGLEKEPTIDAVKEAAEDANTQIVVSGKDEFGNPAKADNNKFALSVPIEEPPEADGELSQRIYDELVTQEDVGNIRRGPISAKVREILLGLLGLL